MKALEAQGVEAVGTSGERDAIRLRSVIASGPAAMIGRDVSVKMTPTIASWVGRSMIAYAIEAKRDFPIGSSARDVFDRTLREKLDEAIREATIEADEAVRAWLASLPAGRSRT